MGEAGQFFEPEALFGLRMEIFNRERSSFFLTAIYKTKSRPCIQGSFSFVNLRYGTRRRRPGIFFSNRVAVMASRYTAAVPRMRHSQRR